MPLDESVEAVNAQDVDSRTGALYRLIDGLDEFNRALLMLYLDDLNHADIGDILGMTAINVATRISRLKQRLRDQVAKEDGEN